MDMSRQGMLMVAAMEQTGRGMGRHSWKHALIFHAKRTENHGEMLDGLHCSQPLMLLRENKLENRVFKGVMEIRVS